MDSDIMAYLKAWFSFFVVLTMPVRRAAIDCTRVLRDNSLVLEAKPVFRLDGVEAYVPAGYSSSPPMTSGDISSTLREIRTKAGWHPPKRAGLFLGNWLRFQPLAIARSF
jgi:hypothetical protein